jgi:hypothetical protein
VMPPQFSAGVQNSTFSALENEILHFARAS